jgi:hypothetical protein
LIEPHYNGLRNEQGDRKFCLVDENGKFFNHPVPAFAISRRGYRNISRNGSRYARLKRDFLAAGLELADDFVAFRVPRLPREFRGQTLRTQSGLAIQPSRRNLDDAGADPQQNSSASLGKSRFRRCAASAAGTAEAITLTLNKTTVRCI